MNAIEERKLPEFHTADSFPWPENPTKALQACDINKDVLNAFLDELGLYEDRDLMCHLNIDLDWHDTGLVRIKVDRISRQKKDGQ
tara:strand:- start:340 stop:594 length:255 start_codon:yes stop_codon:yes gene_type:complete